MEINCNDYFTLCSLTRYIFFCLEKEINVCWYFEEVYFTFLSFNFCPGGVSEIKSHPVFFKELFLLLQCLGTSGVVRKVGSNNVAVVEINNSKWTWNIKTLRLIAKGGE